MLLEVDVVDVESGRRNDRPKADKNLLQPASRDPEPPGTGPRQLSCLRGSALPQQVS